MSRQFKLPCPSCDQPLAVTTTQAGESLSCRCGATVLVPTLREVRRLEAVEDSDAERAQETSWSPLNGGFFVAGLVLIAIGAYGHFRIQPQRRALDLDQPRFQELDFDVQTLTPMQAWEAWEHFRGQTLEFRATPEYLANREKHWELSSYLYLLWGLGTIGLALVIAALVMPGSPRR